PVAMNSDGPPNAMMTDADRSALGEAVRALETASFASRLTSLLGKQLEFAGRAIPERMSQAIGNATTAALNAALRVALLTMHNRPRDASRLLHRALAAASGAAGGALG